MNLGVKKIPVDEFDVIKASSKGRGGSAGSRQEYNAATRLEIGEAVVFQYENYEEYRIGQSWCCQFCSRRNRLKTSYKFEHCSDYKNLKLYLAKKYREAE